MVEIARGVFLRATSWGAPYPEVLALALYAVVALGIASLLNRRPA